MILFCSSSEASRTDFEAVSITVCGVFQAWKSSLLTGSQVGAVNPAMSDVRCSTRRLCSSLSEQRTWTSMNSAAALLATSLHAWRVICKGFTESATTERPTRRFSAAITPYHTEHSNCRVSSQTTDAVQTLLALSCRKSEASGRPRSNRQQVVDLKHPPKCHYVRHIRSFQLR